MARSAVGVALALANWCADAVDLGNYTVTFKTYTLKRNAEQMPGPPTYYFDLSERRTAK